MDSALDCGWEGREFQSHHCHAGRSTPEPLLFGAGSAMGPMGKLGPHSRASSTSRMRLGWCSTKYLNTTTGAAVAGPG